MVLITTSRRRKFRGRNIKDLVSDIRGHLVPGVPVMLSRYHSKDGLTSRTRTLFLSGGGINDEGSFNRARGKRNSCYAELFGNDLSDFRIYHRDPESTHSVALPKQWTGKHYNEGTFSSRGPTSWTTFHESGTQEIVIGDFLRKRYSDAVNSLIFAGDAKLFKLSSFYSVRAFILNIEDQGNSDEKKKEEFAKISSLTACARLLNCAASRLGGYQSMGLIGQIGRGEGYRERLRRRGIPISDTDYVIEESLHPSREIAFLKAGSSGYGDVFVLPASPEMEKLVDLAFAEETIKKHYPSVH